MDAKALAKSKRAHSLHHSKKHNHHQASKVHTVTSGAASGDKKPTGKQATGKPQKSSGSRPLPSNWDRYGEELDLSSADAAGENASRPTEFVLPKSTGGDFAHLISEAKSQSRANYSHDVSPFFTDFIEECTQNFSPLLAAKGRSILSWIADDSFELDDKASTSLEAPFLSLNLNALEEQLSKAKLSERLFVDPDVLPPELLDDEFRALGEHKNDIQTCTTAVAISSGALFSNSNVEEESSNFQKYHESGSSDIVVTRNIPVSTSEEVKQQTRMKDEMLQTQGNSRTISTDSITEHIVYTAPRNPPTFEAATAEAELDMLLNSFTDSQILESSSVGTLSVAATSAGTVKKGTDMMGPPIVPPTIDGAIDDLLEETSLTKMDGKHLADEVKASHDVASALPANSESKLVDDFDSWLDTI